MANILICETSMSLRLLLEHEVGRLAHHVLEESAPAEDVEIAIVEPADPRCLARAAQLRRANPGVCLLFLSELEPTEETQALRPLLHLVKPYSLAELADAIAGAACEAGRTEEYRRTGHTLGGYLGGASPLR